MEKEIMETHEPDVETTSTPEIAIESETTPSTELPIQTEVPTQQPDIATLIAEAEERGYLRGRNEKIAMEMRSPSLWETMREPDDKPEHEKPQPLILNHLRPSVWD
ncbi:MAG: hypothetical protein IJN66_04095 [Muribaculaceae bacterium]|nr:hypothetical protein [Muribaculaceae bacterium]